LPTASICGARPFEQVTAAALARRCGLRVEIADLGAWGGVLLCSEYAASERLVRINRRCVERLEAAERARFVEFALAHELYHHLARSRRRLARLTEECAATRFAERLTSTKVGSIADTLFGTGVAEVRTV
jgi:hypothetical protein